MSSSDDAQSHQKPHFFNRGGGENLNYSNLKFDSQNLVLPSQSESLSRFVDTKQGVVEEFVGKLDNPPEVFQTASSLNTKAGEDVSLVEEDEKNQKIIFFLSVLFFVFSLVALSFYFLPSVVEGRFKFSLGFWSIGKKQVSLPTPSPEVSFLGTPVVVSVVEDAIYQDEILSFKYPQRLSVVRESNEWIIKDPHLEKTKDLDGTIFEISIVSSDKTTPRDYLIDEVVKKDFGLDRDIVESSIKEDVVAGWVVYSYKFADDSFVYVFEERSSKKLVKLLDFSYRLSFGVSKNLAEEIISTLSFSSSSFDQPSPSSVLMLSTPSNFVIEEGN